MRVIKIFWIWYMMSDPKNYYYYLKINYKNCIKLSFCKFLYYFSFSRAVNDAKKCVNDARKCVNDAKYVMYHSVFVRSGILSWWRINETISLVRRRIGVRSLEKKCESALAEEVVHVSQEVWQTPKKIRKQICEDARESKCHVNFLCKNNFEYLEEECISYATKDELIYTPIKYDKCSSKRKQTKKRKYRIKNKNKKVKRPRDGNGKSDNPPSKRRKKTQWARSKSGNTQCPLSRG